VDGLSATTDVVPVVGTEMTTVLVFRLFVADAKAGGRPFPVRKDARRRER
jgi:hypothetical protein